MITHIRLFYRIPGPTGGVRLHTVKTASVLGALRSLYALLGGAPAGWEIKQVQHIRKRTAPEWIIEQL